jgi:hypothetical protein
MDAAEKSPAIHVMSVVPDVVGSHWSSERVSRRTRPVGSTRWCRGFLRLREDLLMNTLGGSNGCRREKAISTSYMSPVRAGLMSDECEVRAGIAVGAPFVMDVWSNSPGDRNPACG